MNSESVRIYLVAAMGANRVIGNGPNIPWKIPGEQKIFRRLTEGKVVVMGRKTFESIGKPLPNRHTLVISRQANYRATGCVVVSRLAPVAKFKLSVLASGSNISVKPTRILRSAYLAR